jgi:hypothetical protein
MLLKDDGGASKSRRLTLDPFRVPVDVVIAQNYREEFNREYLKVVLTPVSWRARADANLFIRQAVVFVAWDGRPLENVESAWC